MARPQTRKVPTTFHEAPDEPEPPNKQILHQNEYRNFRYDIKIFHYRDVRYPVDLLRKFFVAHANGYNFVGSFIGADTIANFQVRPGDEVPRGWMEVGYLANAFSNSKGCALGFRRDGHVIEWFVFREPIEFRVLNRFTINKHTQKIHKQYNLHPDDKWRMFSHVAWTEKGLKERCVKGANPEHRAWWESLDGARSKMEKAKLHLSWHSKGWDYIEMMMNGHDDRGVEEKDDGNDNEEDDKDMMEMS